MTLALTPILMVSIWSGFPSSSAIAAPIPEPIKKTVYISAAPSPASAPTTPTLEPSAYVVPRGGRMSATASGFEPGEKIVLRLGTKVLGTERADAKGGAEFIFTAPYGGVSFELMAIGAKSGLKSSRFLNLANK